MDSREALAEIFRQPLVPKPGDPRHPEASKEEDPQATP